MAATVSSVSVRVSVECRYHCLPACHLWRGQLTHRIDTGSRIVFCDAIAAPRNIVMYRASALPYIIFTMPLYRACHRSYDWYNGLRSDRF